ncbi:MAG: hypothetical protein IPN13_11645 [Bacteroidetes bacterium]|nr:hypothetical protein [Bacteroidota bacterium]
MKIAITDACIFIDLHELELTSELFSLNLEIHTTTDVYNELHGYQREVLKAFISISKLTVHKISEEDRLVIFNSKLPKSLSETDKTVLFLAAKLKAFVLSSDKTVRKSAKSQCIDYHGMLWILDQLVDKSILTKTQALEKLQYLISVNMIYQNNMELVIELEKRVRLWKE